MSPYWLFENHPEIDLSLSINLSHMKAIKNTKTNKESRVRTQIISLDLITNYLNNTNNTTHHQQHQQTMTTLWFGRFWGSLAPQLVGK